MVVFLRKCHNMEYVLSVLGRKETLRSMAPQFLRSCFAVCGSCCCKSSHGDKAVAHQDRINGRTMCISSGSLSFVSELVDTESKQI